MAKVVAGEWKRAGGVDSWAEDSKKLDAMYAESRKVFHAGGVVGLMFHFPVADGRAIYRVVSEKPFTVEHIPFSDAWNANPILLRGLRKADVVEMVRKKIFFEDLFIRKGV
jgi:hypothetical protein